MVAKIIKVIRQELGLSRVQFAKLLKATPSCIYNWENGLRAPREKFKSRIEAFIHAALAANEHKNTKLLEALDLLEQHDFHLNKIANKKRHAVT